MMNLGAGKSDEEKMAMSQKVPQNKYASIISSTPDREPPNGLFLVGTYSDRTSTQTYHIHIVMRYLEVREIVYYHDREPPNGLFWLGRIATEPQHKRNTFA